MAVQQYGLASSAIDKIWYDAETSTLWIKFRKVKSYPQYRYEGVPMAVIVDLLNASSAGSVFHSQIDGNFPSSSVAGPNDANSLLQFAGFAGQIT